MTGYQDIIPEMKSIMLPHDRISGRENQIVHRGNKKI